MESNLVYTHQSEWFKKYYLKKKYDTLEITKVRWLKKSDLKMIHWRDKW